MDQRKGLQQEQLQILSEKIQRLKVELYEASESAALDSLTQLHKRSAPFPPTVRTARQPAGLNSGGADEPSP